MESGCDAMRCDASKLRAEAARAMRVIRAEALAGKRTGALFLLLGLTMSLQLGLTELGGSNPLPNPLP